jgi:hypothetical protein
MQMRLSHEGKQGWELVTFVQSHLGAIRSTHLGVYKRPKETGMLPLPRELPGG